MLLAERDGVLTENQHAELAGHVAECPRCRQFRAALVDSALYLKADAANVPVPDVEAEWQTLQAKLNPEPLHDTAARGADTKKRRLAPVIWFGAPLAAAAAVAIAFLSSAPNASDAPMQVAQASYVEAGDTTASTMVYVDKESGWLVVWASGDSSGG